MEIDCATAMAERGLVVLRSVPGVESVRMGRGVENPGKFMLLVEWRSLDAHAAFSRLPERSEEHTSELQSLMRISYAVFCLKKKTTQIHKMLILCIVANKIDHKQFNTLLI